MLIDRVRVQSETDQSTTYVVTFVADEAVSCTCPHFHFRADAAEFECKHMRGTRNVRPITRAETVRLRQILARG